MYICVIYDKTIFDIFIHMKHYVYKIEDTKTKHFYFGSRSCNCEPSDDEYIGSMKVWKPNKSNLLKTIIKDDFLNREDAIQYESQLISEHIKDELNENYHIPTNGFHTTGMKFSNEHIQKLKKSHCGKNNHMFGKFKNEHQAFGKKRSDEWKLNRSIQTKGENNPMYGKFGKNHPKYGKKHTNETKLKQSISQLGEKNHRFGKHHTDDAKKKLSEYRLGVPRPKATCPHCNKIGGAPQMMRWHFDNCKLKK